MADFSGLNLKLPSEEPQSSPSGASEISEVPESDSEPLSEPMGQDVVDSSPTELATAPANPFKLNLGGAAAHPSTEKLSPEIDPERVAEDGEDHSSTEVDTPPAVESELYVDNFGSDEEDLGGENPLLDDDEELWPDSRPGEDLSKTEILRGTTGEIIDRDDISEEDLSVFEGDFEASHEVVNPLLEDDEDEVVVPSYTPVGGSKVEQLEKTVIENAEPKRFFPKGLDEDFDKRLESAPAKKEVVAAERETKIRRDAAAESDAKEFKSDFQKKTTETVTVNEKGDTRTEQTKERKRLSKAEPKGKLATKEIEFFKNMGSRKSQYTEGLRATDLLAGPLNEFATPQEKRERLDRLERVFDSRVAYRQGASFILNEKMTQVLSFLALFRYAKPNHIAQLFGESPRTAKDRLYRMQQNGLVESRKIYAGTSIWFLTEAGLIVSGYDVRKITDSRLTYSMFPHQFTVNHVAANLWGGKLNVLGLSDFPVNNRVDMKGHPRLGEQLTSELEILSAFSKMKLFEDAAQFRPKLMDIRDTEFKKWVSSDDRGNVPSPEMIYGNEWMYTMFPPLSVGIAYHVPDLVVKRPRSADGTPKSIAIEVEINNKPESSYRRSLQAFADDKVIFDKVIWVCKTIGPAKKLEKIGRELGIVQSGKLKIVPIWIEGGVFKARDLWTI